MRRKTAWGLAIYAALVLLMASCRAWQVHTAPIDCNDGYGHGPDPGGTECERAMAIERANRPQDTYDAFFAVILVGGIGLGAYGALRLATRIGRRFVQDKDASP